MTTPTHTRNALRLIAASTAAIAAAQPSLGAVKSWMNDDGTWNVASNWSPLGMPAPGDFVTIGNTAIAENGWVNLNVNATIAGLVITDGMVVDTNTSWLIVSGDTTISGENQGDGVIYPSAVSVGQGPAGIDFATENLTISDGGDFRLWGGANASIGGLLDLGDGCSVWGSGVLRLNGDGPVAFKVNGSVGAQTDGLTILQLGTGLIDLDGDVPGDHTLNVTLSKIDGSAFSWLTIDGTSLTDTFDEDIWLSGHNVLSMNLDEAWAMGPNTELRFFGNTSFPGPGELNGAPLSMSGDITASGGPAHGQVNAAITLNPSVDAAVGIDDLLEFNGTTTILGGTYTVDEGGEIRFDGTTSVQGGTFATPSISSTDGEVRFNGATTWNGSVSMSGYATQNGNATVSGPTTITADLFNFDGTDGTTSWSIGNNLVINAQGIDEWVNIFDGSLNLTGGFLGKLTVNLTPGAHWAMDGSMTAGGVAALMITRVAGSPMDVTGDLFVSGKVQFTAPTALLDSATLTFDSPSSVLRLGAKSLVATDATILGAGTLETSTSGDLTLANVANLDAAGLLNAGVTRIGSPTGLAFVDRFENTASGTFAVDIGGPLPGLDHDLLIVDDGGAALAGEIDVRVVDLGNGVFAPEIGDSFPVLQTSGTVSGAFANQPISFAPGMVYLWSVATNRDSVVLTLDDAVPCPADLSGDGVIDAADLAILLGAWGPCPGCLADLDGSGAVDPSDLAILLGSWGPCSF